MDSIHGIAALAQNIGVELPAVDELIWASLRRTLEVQFGEITHGEFTEIRYGNLDAEGVFWPVDDPLDATWRMFVLEWTAG